MTAASDEEAVRIVLSVWLFTAVVCVSVCALTFVVSFAVAVFTSAVVARVPELKPAPVKVRAPNDQIAVGVVPVFVESWRPVVPAVMRVEVATFQTSAASVPKFESVLVVLAQTAVGMVAKSEVEAVRTVASVCALMFVATVSV
jgi:predicted RNA-binding Zn ribbon-like protein